MLTVLAGDRAWIPKLSHILTAPQGEGAFLGYIALLSEAPLEGGGGPDELCLPAQHTYARMFPGSESQRLTFLSPLLLPAIPVPTPTLPGGLLSYPGGGGRDLPGHKLLAVLSLALGSPAESAPMPCPGAFLQLSLGYPVRAPTVLRPC